MTSKSQLIVIAGANGAGKSTFTRHAQSLNVPIVDPDAEARAINPDVLVVQKIYSVKG